MRALQGGVGLGDDRGVGAHPRAQQVSCPGASLELSHDAGDDQLSVARKTGSLRGGGGDHRGDPGFHVPDTGSEEHVSLGRGLKRIARQAVRKRVDVDVAVQHQALAASRPAEPRDALEPPGIHFLEVGLEPQFLETIVEDHRRGICLTFTDRGPGIRDIEMALKDGYTSGTGLGLGLGGARRLSSEFHISSEVGAGTRVVIRRWR